MRIIGGALLLIMGAAPLAQTNDTRDLAVVIFVNSGASAAQAEFTRGLTQLHNFEYDDAAVHFRAAQTVDPSFAMAYWGEAMTKNHGIWHEQDLAAAREVLAKLGATPAIRQQRVATAREKQYLDSIEVLYGEGSKEERDQKYMAVMARLHQRYP